MPEGPSLLRLRWFELRWGEWARGAASVRGASFKSCAKFDFVLSFLDTGQADAMHRNLDAPHAPQAPQVSVLVC